MLTTATLANLVDGQSLPAATAQTSSKWHRAKLILRLLSSALAVAVAVQSVVLLPNPVPITSPLLPLTLGVACISWNSTLLYTMRQQKAWISNALRVHIAIEILLWIIGLTATAMQMASITIRTQDNPDAGIWNEDWGLTATLCPLVIIHFTLFIQTCSESARRKRAKQVQQLIRTLLHENERASNLSIVSPPGQHQYRPPTDAPDLSYKMSPISELFSPTVIAELPAVIELVELPGDYEHTRCTES